VPVPPGTRFAASGPQGSRFIVAGGQGAAVIGREGQPLAALPHPAEVLRAEFSPNTLRIATAGRDGSTVVWSEFGKRLHAFPGQDDSNVYDVDFSHTSRLLVVASSDGTARVFNVRTGQRESVMPLHGNQVRRARFGANEDSVVTASRDRTARTWKVDTGGPRAVFAGHTEPVTAAVFIPGDRVATASEDGTVRTWVAQLQPPLRPAGSTPAPRPGLDPRATVTGSVVTLRIHGRVVTLEGHRDDVLSVEVSRDGSRVVTASKDSDARIWDARTGELRFVLSGHFGTVFDASFSPNGRWVVTGGPTTAGLWDASNGERIFFLRGDGTPVRAAAFSSPTRIVVRGSDGVRSYVCELCGGLKALLELADRRLAATGRELSAAERATYVGG
jgi:WD40 repeat protein